MAKKEITFEEAMERLNEIVHRMESGDESMEQALKSYEEGVGLIRFCTERLENAEKRVKMLQMQADGEGKLVDFGATEDEK